MFELFSPLPFCLFSSFALRSHRQGEQVPISASDGFNLELLTFASTRIARPPQNRTMRPARREKCHRITFPRRKKKRNNMRSSFSLRAGLRRADVSLLYGQMLILFALCRFFFPFPLFETNKARLY